MKNKCNKIKDTCGGIVLADCVSYEGTTNEVSPLSTDCQLSIEETTQDIYTQLEEINLEALENSVLDYVKTTEGRVIVKDAFIKIDSEIIALKDRVTELEGIALCEQSVVPCDFDFGLLVDQCGNKPDTLSGLLQLILDTLNTP